MRKAHLFEAAYKFNLGIDDAVGGVKRMGKAPELTLDAYEEGAAELELCRSKVNVQFLSDLVDGEKAAVQRFDHELNELRYEPLDHFKVCRLMRVVEQERKDEGMPPLVEFLAGAPTLDEDAGNPEELQPNPSPQPPAATA